MIAGAQRPAIIVTIAKSAAVLCWIGFSVLDTAPMIVVLKKHLLIIIPAEALSATIGNLLGKERYRVP